MSEERKTRVLVVDDSSFLRNKLRKILEQNGLEVVAEAETGVDAIKKTKEANPDLITMDIVMPELNGIEALKILRLRYPRIPVIMISSVGAKDKVLSAKKFGAQNFILKPFREELVMKVVNRALGHADADEQ